MTALAVYLQERGYAVTGSDLPEVFLTDEVLARHAIPISCGFSPDDVPHQCDVVVVTGAHGGMTNPQAVAAKERGIPTFMHGVFLGQCMQGKKGISVAGCHGKTTTSALISSMLMATGHDPSYAVGAAVIPKIGDAGHFGKGAYFVAEADEYVTCPCTDPTPRFLWQHPDIAVITNIDYDHPDVYPSLDAVKDAYRRFLGNITLDGVVIACGDDPNVRSILSHVPCRVMTYGVAQQNDYRVTDIAYHEGESTFHLRDGRGVVEECTIHIPGAHNAVNAAAAALVAREVGLSWSDIRRVLPQYWGAKRRFERLASVNNILFYDDYAHHPEEIIATLRAARSWFPSRRLVVLFQPHTYSRTKRLLNEFAKSFSGADVMLVADIFPSAREQADASVSSELLVAEAKKYLADVCHVSGKKQAVTMLTNVLAPNDLFLTMGAGDIYRWQPEIISVLGGSYGTMG